MNQSFDVGSRLREIRIESGQSQRQLAENAGVPHGQISMIETNRSSPSVASLRKILGGLGMTMSEFFEPDTPREVKPFFLPDELVDLTSRLANRSDNKEKTITLRQVGDAKLHGLQILHEHYQPGADTGDTMLEHEASEGGIVVAGEIEVTVGSTSRILRTGDAYLFDSRDPHRFRNLSDEPAEIISACTPPYL